jgi:hypothetical protein
VLGSPLLANDAQQVLRDAGYEHLASPVASTVMGVPFRAPATGS